MNKTIHRSIDAIYANDYEGDYCACVVVVEADDLKREFTITAKLMPEYAKHPWFADRPHTYSDTIPYLCGTTNFEIAREECAAHVLFPSFADSSDYYADYWCDVPDRGATGGVIPAYEFVPYDMED